LNRTILDFARAKIKSPECHWTARAEYALLLGKHGDAADRSLVKSLLHTRENDLERRAFVAALHTLPPYERREVINAMKRDFPALSSVVHLMEKMKDKPEILPAAM
jgi:hypothetical protein